jgi:hypothetical protein
MVAEGLAADGPTPAAPLPVGDAPTIAPEFELVTVEYQGMRWNVPKQRGQWDMNVQFCFEEGRRLMGTFILLGGSPENVARVKEQVYSKCRTAYEVDKFIDHCAEILNKECVG